MIWLLFSFAPWAQLISSITDYSARRPGPKGTSRACRRFKVIHFGAYRHNARASSMVWLMRSFAP